MRLENSSLTPLILRLLDTSGKLAVMGKPFYPMTELSIFLRAAKLATYAAQSDAASVAPVLPDSKQLEYREGEYFYRDIYYGMFHFVGQEIVYRSGRAIWSMAYSGGLAASVEVSSAAAIYSLLRAALSQAPRELPLRGPANYEATSMNYTCSCEGSLEQFHGIERILREGVPVYELWFGGGKLS